MDLVF